MAHILAGVLGILSLTTTSLAVTAGDFVPRATGSLDSFLSSETPIALQGLLDNIGPDGAFTAGARPGIVIASPSKSDPNCMFVFFCCTYLVADANQRLFYLDTRLCAHGQISCGSRHCWKHKSPVDDAAVYQR